MSSYLAILGSTPDLSLAELESQAGSTVEQVSSQVVSLELEGDEAAHALLDILGGTVKILKQLDHDDVIDQETVQPKVIDLLTKLASEQNNDIDFALSELGRDHLPVIQPGAIKDVLKDAGIKVRYVEGSRHGLNAASLKSNYKVIELTVMQTDTGIYYGQTVSVQDVDDWAKRDRQKPFAEHKRGLLPPKVARMMVNMALGNQANRLGATENRPVLCDPFCGSGTILMEAMLRGCDVVGGDIETAASKGTEDNLVWFRQEYPEAEGVKSEVLLADATQLPLAANSVTHLVTEPFLGKPKPLPEQLPNIYRGLERMYLGAFKHWRSFLADNATLVVIFPIVELGDDQQGRRFTLEALIDKLADFGYTTHSEPIMYARPNAVVQRAIYTFTYVTR